MKRRKEVREVRKKSEKSEMILYSFPGSLSSCPGEWGNGEKVKSVNQWYLTNSSD